MTVACWEGCLVASCKSQPAVGAVCWAQRRALGVRSWVRGALLILCPLVHFHLTLGLYPLLYPELPETVLF